LHQQLNNRQALAIPVHGAKQALNDRKESGMAQIEEERLKPALAVNCSSVG